MIDLDQILIDVQNELGILFLKLDEHPDDKLDIVRRETPILYDYLMKEHRKDIKWHRSKKVGIRRCYECWEYFENDGEQITYEQYHPVKNCPMYDWIEYICGCDNVRKELDKKHKLDTEDKQDDYFSNQPDCSCKKKTYHWVCEDCRTEGC